MAFDLAMLCKTLQTYVFETAHGCPSNAVTCVPRQTNHGAITVGVTSKGSKVGPATVRETLEAT